MHNGVKYLITARGMFPLPAEGNGIPPALVASASMAAAPRGGSASIVPPPTVNFDQMKKAMDKSEDAEAKKEAYDIQSELKKISDRLQSMPDVTIGLRSPSISCPQINSSASVCCCSCGGICGY